MPSRPANRTAADDASFPPQRGRSRQELAHRGLFLVLALCLVLPARAETIKVLVQSSPLAGFQFYAGKTLWDEMQTGDVLVLAREADNRHDTNAVRVEWRGRRLGYLPRAENRAVAAEMDRGGKLAARIARLNRHLDPWKRIQVEVFVVL